MENSQVQEAVLSDLKLSCPMRMYLMGYEKGVRSSTIDALQKRKLLVQRPFERPQFTEKGLEWVKGVCAKSRAHQETELPGVPVIETHEDLQCILTSGKPDVRRDIYVYRGRWGLIVDEGNGQDPVAVVHPYLHWEIRWGKARPYLEMVSVIGHKGSYCYQLKRGALRAA